MPLLCVFSGTHESQQLETDASQQRHGLKDAISQQFAAAKVGAIKDDR